jgi:hypothetical protein
MGHNRSDLILYLSKTIVIFKSSKVKLIIQFNSLINWFLLLGQQLVFYVLSSIDSKLTCLNLNNTTSKM